MSETDIARMMAEAITPLEARIIDLERKVSRLENRQLKKDEDAMLCQTEGDGEFQRQVAEPKSR